MKKLEITTVINVKDNITENQIATIKEEFEELAWDWDDSEYQPKVEIVEISDENDNYKKAIEICQTRIDLDRKMRNNESISDYDKFCENECLAIETLINYCKNNIN